MNKITITAKINDETVDLSKYLLLPVSFNNLLDERLDELYLELRACPIYQIPLLTNFAITIETETASDTHTESDIKNLHEITDNIAVASDDGYSYGYNSDRLKGKIKLVDGKLYDEYTFNMVIVNDSAVEKPVGSGYYTHQISLMEETKILEGFIGDTITFRNILGKEYNSITSYSTGYTTNMGKPHLQKLTGNFRQNYYKRVYYTEKGTQSAFFNFLSIKKFADMISPSTSSSITIQTVSDSLPVALYLFKAENFTDDYYNLGVDALAPKCYWAWLIYPLLESTENTYQERWYSDGKFVIRGNYYSSSATLSDVTYGTTKNFSTMAIQKGDYVLMYQYQTVEGAGSTQAFTMNISIIGGLDNKEPSKKYTIKDVVERILDTVEALDQKDSPRFKLSSSQMYELDQIIAPEFTFSQMTLREMLKQVGSFIGCEPRLEDHTIYFDKIGDSFQSYIANSRYNCLQMSSTINDFCLSLDTSVANMTTTMGNDVLCYNPSRTGMTTVRCESYTTKLSDTGSGAIIPTQLPIEKLIEVKADYNGTIVDITGFIYESADYNSLLTAYKSGSAFSKAFSLYYTQGGKNIGGLWFEAPTTWGVSNYTIYNILKQLGVSVANATWATIQTIGYRVKYIPQYSCRVKTSKQAFNGITPRTLAYNQASNMVESRYYGKNLQSTVERMGNIETTISYTIGLNCETPKVGAMYNDEWYISAVKCEYYASYIQCTVGLSKNFTKLSEAVGINSNRRMWEVSEREAVKRQSVMQDFLVFSHGYSISNSARCFTTYNKPYIYALENGSAVSHKGLTIAVIGIFKDDTTTQGNVIQDTTVPFFCAPILTSAFGNSIVCTIQADDSYSVGQKLTKQDDYKYADYVRLANDYGRAKYYGFYLFPETESDSYNPLTNADTIPSSDLGNGTTDGAISWTYWLYEKDSIEIPQWNFELTAVPDIKTGNYKQANGNTHYYNDENLVIGNGFSLACPLLGTDNLDVGQLATLYVGIKPLTRVAEKIDATNWVAVGKISIVNNEVNYYNQIDLPNPANISYSYYTESTYTNKYYSWAIAIPLKSNSETVCDNDGNISVQTTTKGGEIIVGENSPVPKNLYLHTARKHPKDKF